MTTQSPPGFHLVLDYLRAKRPDLPVIDPELDLIENRILDSLGFIDFLYLLEESTGTEITLDSVSAEDFRTLNRIKARFFGA
ncbi:MAG: hypothetical protein AVDCRST_MAG41-2222 [uncultured Corynebacteriales bacterium]|uniref:Carrier domain-containing protein n=1 Tax=uncultured Mycobacteriales bacterium TaxID=581187 RepID=A0A6J4IMZ2_9ACTN|nr:MAG: hypothetical protein AVDCRST_MAG41-2222 [uncultured Corynebacteriales bacterium]